MTITDFTKNKYFASAQSSVRTEVFSQRSWTRKSLEKYYLGKEVKF